MLKVNNFILFLFLIAMIAISCSNKIAVTDTVESIPVETKEETTETFLQELDLSMLNGKWQLYRYGKFDEVKNNVTEFNEKNIKITEDDAITIIIDRDSETLTGVKSDETASYKIIFYKNAMNLYQGNETEKKGTFIIYNVNDKYLTILKEDPSKAEKLIPWIFKRIN